MYYTIKQFAEMFHITEHTVRYYTDIELLPCKRDSANHRIFDEESVNWMQGITCLKRCGASVGRYKGVLLPVPPGGIGGKSEGKVSDYSPSARAGA